MGIADYLSRHPSPIERESVNASDLWKTWFIVNHVNNILAAETNRPIRRRQWMKP